MNRHFSRLIVRACYAAQGAALGALAGTATGTLVAAAAGSRHDRTASVRVGAV
ncbi:MAG: hypothetical protein RI988_2449 [Pseudomonadota bacterium]|jgi:hypothetical protein